MSKTKNKLEFSVERDGQSLKLVAVKPTLTVDARGDAVRAAAFVELLKAKVPLKSNLLDAVREQGLWPAEKDAELEAIDTRLRANLAKLPDGQGRVATKGLKATEVRAAAVEVRVDRIRRVRLLAPVTDLEASTAEGMAENAKFNFLVSQCVQSAHNGTPYFDSPADYLERAEDPDALECASKFANVYWGVAQDYQKDYPENKFLVGHKMADDSLHLIDRQGRRCDVGGVAIPEPEAAPKAEFALEDDWGTPAADEKAPSPAEITPEAGPEPHEPVVADADANVTTPDETDRLA